MALCHGGRAENDCSGHRWPMSRVGAEDKACTMTSGFVSVLTPAFKSGMTRQAGQSLRLKAMQSLRTYFRWSRRLGGVLCSLLRGSKLQAGRARRKSPRAASVLSQGACFRCAGCHGQSLPGCRRCPWPSSGLCHCRCPPLDETCGSRQGPSSLRPSSRAGNRRSSKRKARVSRGIPPAQSSQKDCQDPQRWPSGGGLIRSFPDHIWLLISPAGPSHKRTFSEAELLDAPAN